MFLQHYFPATYLAFFSKEKTLLEGKNYFSCFTSNGKIIDRKASQICKENNLYENAFRDPKISIDDNWTYFESELALAIELLSNKNLSALSWAMF